PSKKRLTWRWEGVVEVPRSGSCGTGREEREGGRIEGVELPGYGGPGCFPAGACGHLAGTAPLDALAAGLHAGAADLLPLAAPLEALAARLHGRSADRVAGGGEAGGTALQRLSAGLVARTAELGPLAAVLEAGAVDLLARSAPHLARTLPLEADAGLVGRGQ